MTGQSCGKCRWFKKFREEHEFGLCTVHVPFWLYKEMMKIVRPDLNQNEGKDCAAWEEKPNG